MKKTSIISLITILAVCGLESQATPIYSDNFNSYTNGPLVGQGGWAQTGPTTTSPIQVDGGAISLLTGQDANVPISGSPVSLADGESMYFGLMINVSAAKSAGDYFFHFSPDGGTSQFYSRLFVQSSGSGYVLGWLGTSGSGSTVTYGATELNLNQSYNIVVAYNYSATTDTSTTGDIYVDPTDPAVGNNTAYLSSAWGSPNPATNVIATVNFRQGGSSSAPALTVDGLVASKTFSDTISPAPEPSTMAIAAIGGAAFMLVLRRKR